MALTVVRDTSHDHAKGARSDRYNRVNFDRRVPIGFRESQISSGGGLQMLLEVDDPLGLSDMAVTALRDTRGGKNIVHWLHFLSRQSVFRRLPGHEDVLDADHLAFDPILCQDVHDCIVDAQVASAS